MMNDEKNKKAKMKKAAEKKVPDMSNAHMDDDMPDIEGEDPSIKEAQDKATEELAAFLMLHDIEVDYGEADWRDNAGLVEITRELANKHPTWAMYYFGGDTWGIDANYVFFVSKQVESEVVETIGTLLLDEGACLPGEEVRPKPKCPMCGKEVDLLRTTTLAEISGWVSLLDGNLNFQLNEEERLWELVFEGSLRYFCPHCDGELFRESQEPEVRAFLTCTEGFVWRNPRMITMPQV